MKKISVILVVVMLFSAMTLVATADSVFETVTATLRGDIKIVINGEEFNPKDAVGNDITPVVIDGSTYLPVRAISEAVDLPVNWDGETNTVSLGTTSVSKSIANFDVSGSSRVSKVIDKSRLVFEVGDVITEEKQFDFALQVDTVNSASKNFTVTLDNGYSYFSTIIASEVDTNVDIVIKNDEDMVLFQTKLEPEEIVQIKDIELYNADVLKIEVNGRISGNNGNVFLLDPVVR
ncbi:copper amine oxidase-like protein [Natranaerovirga hydrolytica]|uniref:Copper amine oxidase-like protein n=1 Tax=Natranaerovirga hydrolytica TaxID=680378 RepID=A0A4R1MZ10_9FIRM|nr:stalk domain-containing protein [Natranaerovirga hydrolytica]TCK98558.1 copper amine oxidase-like protein [Natranaerovirga hydrolytica]